jgi:hypothetical protein
VEIFNKDFPCVHNSKREKKSLSSSDFVTAADMVQREMAQQSANLQRAITGLGGRSGAAERLTRVCPSALGHLYFSFALQPLLHRLTESGAAKFHAQTHIPT